MRTRSIGGGRWQSFRWAEVVDDARHGRLKQGTPQGLAWRSRRSAAAARSYQGHGITSHPLMQFSEVRSLAILRGSAYFKPDAVTFARRERFW